MNLLGARYLFLKRYTLILIDFLIVNSGIIAGYIYKYAGTDKNAAKGLLIIYTIAFNALWLGLSYVFKLYAQKTAINVEIIYRSTWKVTAIHILVFSGLALFNRNSNIPVELQSLFICYTTIAIQLIVSRFFITYIVEFVIKKGNLKKKTAIIGINSRAKELAAYFGRSGSAYSFQGFFSDHQLLNYAGADSILATVSECIDYAVAEGINEIYSTLLPDNSRQVNEVLTKAERHCVRIKFVVDEPITNYSGEVFYRKQKSSHSFKVINLRNEPLENFTNKIKKRFFDFIISSFITIFILSWLIPLIGILIKLESKGPVFFIQKRSGQYNREFNCIKFRTMHTKYENDTSHATKDDDRITKVGAFLRKNSLDELPQFLNVLIGNMSVAGPRPHMLEHTEQYSKIINSFMVRQMLKPGISGWAQINGLRGEIKEPELMERRVSYDIWYMENWSLMMDIKIIFMTIINIFRGDENAY